MSRHLQHSWATRYAFHKSSALAAEEAPPNPYRGRETCPVRRRPATGTPPVSRRRGGAVRAMERDAAYQGFSAKTALLFSSLTRMDCARFI